MKKTISLLLAAIMILSLLFTAVSCRKDEAAPETTEEPISTEESAPTEMPDVTEPPTEETDVPPEPDDPSPLMWRVTDDAGHTLYLFGTIHVGDARNDAVLERISPVLGSCDALAVEFDAVAYEKNTQQMMIDMMQYVLTNGSVISDYMPGELYQRAYDLLKEAGLMPDVFKVYNLALWSQMVDQALLEIYADLDTSKGMDRLLIRYAYDKDIPVLDVESAQFQMALLNSFDNELYLLSIESSLNNAGEYNSEVNKMYELWLYGDRDTLWAYITNEDETGDYTDEQLALIEDYNYRLVDERNLGMRDKAIEYLNSGDTVFFAVGAAHMANEAGLVQLLIDAGYTVEQITYGD
ncbi:MAG: TraB/GumN family protein [Oscillospiraceae bacterium]|nr:TraB/GumN family protein [Oscillospiraceae bacterium]